MILTLFFLWPHPRWREDALERPRVSHYSGRCDCGWEGPAACDLKEVCLSKAFLSEWRLRFLFKLFV